MKYLRIDAVSVEVRTLRLQNTSQKHCRLLGCVHLSVSSPMRQSCWRLKQTNEETCSPVRYVRLLNPGVKEHVNPTAVISGSTVSTACHLHSHWHNPAQESTNCGSRALETEWRM
jgi:hypothetical protein